MPDLSRLVDRLNGDFDERDFWLQRASAAILSRNHGQIDLARLKRQRLLNVNQFGPSSASLKGVRSRVNLNGLRLIKVDIGDREHRSLAVLEINRRIGRSVATDQSIHRNESRLGAVR